MKDFNTYEHIENYLKGTMAEQDRVAFEVQLANDEALNKKVEAHQLADDLIIDQKLLGISALIKKEQIKETSKAKTIKTAGATIVTIGLLGLGYLLFSNELTEKDTINNSTEVQSQEETEHLPKTDQQNLMTPSTTKEKVKPTTIPSFAKESESEIHIKEQEKIVTEELQSPHEDVSIPVQETKKNSETTPTLDIDLICKKTELKASITPIASCYNMPEGSIKISNIKGGLAPYEIFISERSGKTFLPHEKLHPGTYQVDLIDANGCMRTIDNVRVEGKDCSIKLAFNPFIGETLNLSDHFEKGTIKITDQKGSVVIEKTLQKGETFTWDGTNTNGEIIQGYYILIHEVDHQVQNAEITLLK